MIRKRLEIEVEEGRTLICTCDSLEGTIVFTIKEEADQVLLVNFEEAMVVKQFLIDTLSWSRGFI